ncbi:MAG: HupE/UreJ family protein [Arenicellales bacterium]|nr:HupE/UreJ family protein [Arenicellales bacterium]
MPAGPLFLILLSLCCYTQVTWAHEIRPAIVELSFSEPSQAELEITLNLEALIAEIGPDHNDTTESRNATIYDELRALPPYQLEREFETFKTKFLQGISIHNQNGARLTIEVTSLTIPEVGDTDLARSSKIGLGASLAAGTRHIVWSWDENFGANIVRVGEKGSDDEYSVYLIKGKATDPIPVTGNLTQSAVFVFWNYLVIGFTHILPKGLDHILFVVGLFLLSTRMRPLVFQITSFTIAHTITLALATTGVVDLPPSIVEPLIALSIVYVCVENIFTDKLQRWRPVIVFGFGLLHGLGFAGVLSEVGISPAYFVTALVSFNLGVELGQITVIVVCFLLVGFWFRDRPWYRSVITIPISIVIAAIGSYWFLQRSLLI